MARPITSCIELCLGGPEGHLYVVCRIHSSPQSLCCDSGSNPSLNLAFHYATLIDLRGGRKRLGGYHDTTDHDPIQQSIKCSILVAWIKEGQPRSVAARPCVACKPSTPSRSRRSSVWPDPEQARKRTSVSANAAVAGSDVAQHNEYSWRIIVVQHLTKGLETAPEIRSTSFLSSRHPCTPTGPVKTGGPEMASSKLQRPATWTLAKYRRQIGRDIILAVWDEQVGIAPEILLSVVAAVGYAYQARWMSLTTLYGLAVWLFASRSEVLPL